MPKKDKLEQFYELIEDIETAMFTTRRADGLLVSRPMATQARASGADLWFVTDRRSAKLEDIRHDANVNVSYFNNRTKEWVSVAGTAKLIRTRDKIRELYRPDWRAWFGSEGGEKDGTADDPRIVLIGVKVKVALYLEVNKPMPVVLFEVVKGIITGNRPDFQPPQQIEGDVVRKGRSRLNAKAAAKKKGLRKLR